MAVIKDPGTVDNTVSYIATLAFFCCVSCVTLMLKFGGFKASLNFYNGKRSKANKEHGEIGSVVSITGAYRTNRDESFGYHNLEAHKKATPSIVPVTTEQPGAPLRQVKSTSDLIKTKNVSPNLTTNNPGVSQDPRGAEHNETRKSNSQEKDKDKKLDAQKKVEKQRRDEQKKLEKQRLEEHKKIEKHRLEDQKKQENIALQEQAKQEKLRKEREKKEAIQAKKDKKKKKTAPLRPLANPLGQANTSTSNNPLAQNQTNSNTLESSISKTSGPPPYSEIPKPEGENDSSGNVIYSKPIDTGSWDMISKHRQNINRPMNTAATKPAKQTMMDLKYKVDEGNENGDNSEV